MRVWFQIGPANRVFVKLTFVDLQELHFSVLVKIWNFLERLVLEMIANGEQLIK